MAEVKQIGNIAEEKKFSNPQTVSYTHLENRKSKDGRVGKHERSILL